MHLDHIVVVVPSLDYAKNLIKDSLGCEVSFGGKHESIGTHNAILGIGNNRQYIEFLTIDPDDSTPRGDYPLGIEKNNPSHYVSAWAAQTSNIDDIAKQFMELGKVFNQGHVRLMNREKPDGTLLEWKIAYKKEQTLESKGVSPFLIDWQNSQHPTCNLTEESTCNLVNFKIYHPFAKNISRSLQLCGMSENYFEESDSPGFLLVLEKNGNYLKINGKMAFEKQVGLQASL